MRIHTVMLANRFVFIAGVIATAAAIGPRSAAAQGPVVSLEDRIRGANAVVVAEAATVSAGWQQNTFGDRLIVSRVLLRVEETLKGSPQSTLALDVEGGTLDGITLRVSSEPLMTPGERAVFMLDQPQSGIAKSHLRGLGILKLDGQNKVQGSSLSLDEIRNVAAALRTR